MRNLMLPVIAFPKSIIALFVPTSKISRGLPNHLWMNPALHWLTLHCL